MYRQFVTVFSLACLTGLTVACAGTKLSPEGPVATKPAVIQFHAPSNTPDNYKLEVEKAAEVWALQTRGLAQISVSWDDVKEGNTLTVMSTQSPEGFKKLYGDCGPDLQCLMGVVGLTTSGGIHNPWGIPVEMTLFADRALEAGPNVLMQVTLHEMGHALGLPHSDAVQAMMYPMIIDTKHVCLRKPDLALFCQVNDCGSTDLIACE